jgi:hypothetical protein
MARAQLTAIQKITRYGWTTRNSMGELANVEKAALSVDPRYQRDRNEHQISIIRRDFNWLAFGALIVAEREDGTLWVVEGQQRLAAAMGRADIEKVPCVIFQVGDIRSEAQAFLDTNGNRKPVSSVDLFRSHITTEEPVTIRCDALIKEAGYRVSRSSSGKTIACVSAMQRCSRMSHTALAAAWPIVVELSVGEPIHHRLLESLWYLERNAAPSICERPFRSKLLRIGRDGLLARIASSSSYYASGGARVWAKGVMDALNHGSRSNSLSLKQEAP